jgi:hypothetical protein
VNDEQLRDAVTIVVDGVELTVKQTENRVRVSRVSGRDRKRKLDITSSESFYFDIDYAVIAVVQTLKRVAAMSTARCTCDYRYGYSDHAEHCQSIYVAEEFRGEDD